MAFRGYLELTDPKVLRALAHPARMSILSHLADAGPSTATECADAAEASPSACSYHLRRLGEFGLVEAAPTEDGRERRWQLAVTGYGIPKEVQDRPEILAAMRPLTRRWIEGNERVVEDYLANEHHYEPRWRKAATFQQTNPSVTPEELIRIGERIQKVFRPYQERKRAPDGAQRIHASFIAVPWPATGRPGGGGRKRKRTNDGRR